jgi:hypothetical protein
LEIHEFRHALKLGLGRAVLFVDGPLAAQYSDALLEACLHTKVYDPQIEGPRGRYLLDVVNRTGNPSFYTDRILEGLEEGADHWDAVQFFGLARLLVQEGNSRARGAMITSFEANVASTSVDDYVAEFIHLDGVEGLLFALERIGASLRGVEKPWASDSLRRQAGEILGEDAVTLAIAERAQTSANVAAYVDAENSYDTVWAAQFPPRSEKALSYLQFQIQVASAGLQEWPVWGRNAGPVELRLAALDLIQQTEPRKLMQYLRIFWRHPFPLDYEHLFRFTNSTDRGVPPHALKALSKIKDDRIRRFALALVENRSPRRGHAVQLLVKNFRDGDHEMVKDWCEKESDPEELNCYRTYLRDFLREHPNLEIEIDLLTMFYDRQLCAHCRSDDVERLIELNALPDDLRAESQFDSYLETRELVAG